jgi:hypothetical protein
MFAVGGGIVGLLMIIIVIVAVVLMKRRKTRSSDKHQMHANIELAVPRSPSFIKKKMASWTPLRDVEIGIKLGGGDFGEVFKGKEFIVQYPDDIRLTGVWQGSTVALKKMVNGEDFFSEASILE